MEGVAIIEAFNKIAFEYYVKCAEDALNEGEDLPDIIIQNMAICYAHCFEAFRHIDDMNYTYDIGSAVYDGCVALFKKYRQIPSLIPIDIVISSMFPIMTDVSINIFYPVPKIDEIIVNIYKNGSEESYLQTANMITIACTHIPNFQSAKFLHECIIHCMKSDLQGTRKAGVEALRALVHNHYEGEYNEDLSKDYLSVWETYISIFETFDEFPLHLIKDMWSRIQPIQQSMRSTVNTDYYVHYWRAGEDKSPPEKRKYGRFGTYPVDILLENGDYKSVLLKSEVDQEDLYRNKTRRYYDFEYSHDKAIRRRRTD